MLRGISKWGVLQLNQSPPDLTQLCHLPTPAWGESWGGGRSGWLRGGEVAASDLNDSNRFAAWFELNLSWGNGESSKGFKH